MWTFPIISVFFLNVVIILLLLLLLATLVIHVCTSLSPLCAVSMWTMAHHQVAAPWTPWPARAQASSCRLILSTVSGESRSCTAPTATTTSRPSLCPETPPLPVTCECTVSFTYPWTFIKGSTPRFCLLWCGFVFCFLNLQCLTLGLPHSCGHGGKSACPVADCIVVTSIFKPIQ